MDLFPNLKTILVVVLLPFGCIGDNLRFPDNFSIGAATSSYQIEGGWDEDGKGENVWDEFTHRIPSPIVDNSTGDVACDSYHKYEKDIEALHEIGFDHYRFSLSWARILPDGNASNVNKKGVEYYHNLLDKLIAKGIKPYVTIYHWDHPQVFEEFGGWTNEKIVDLFADYARLVFEEFGTKVKIFLTINEPTIFCSLGYGSQLLALGRNGLQNDQYLCVHNALKAHARAYHIYDQEFRPRQNGQISIVLECSRFYPENPNDTVLDNVAFQFSCGWAAHPIFSGEGDYPNVMKDFIANSSTNQGLSESRLPTFSDHWISYINGTADFFALSHYTSYLLSKGPGLRAPFYTELRVNLTFNPDWEKSDRHFIHIVPEGFRSLLNLIKSHYGNPAVYVMENGISSCGSTNDVKRLHFFKSYMTSLLKAIHEDGCNVKAYTVWSLLDTFEWQRGHRECFGVVHVDFNDIEKKRTLKLSAYWFKEALTKRDLEVMDESKLENFTQNMNKIGNTEHHQIRQDSKTKQFKTHGHSKRATVQFGRKEHNGTIEAHGRNENVGTSGKYSIKKHIGIIGGHGRNTHDAIIARHVRNGHNGTIGGNGRNEHDGTIGGHGRNEDSGKIGGHSKNEHSGKIGGHGRNAHGRKIAEHVRNEDDATIAGHGRNENDETIGGHGNDEYGGTIGEYDNNEQDRIFGGHDRNEHDRSIGTYGRNEPDETIGGNGRNNHDGSIGGHGKDEYGGTIGEYDNNEQDKTIGEYDSHEHGKTFNFFKKMFQGGDRRKVNPHLLRGRGQDKDPYYWKVEIMKWVKIAHSIFRFVNFGDLLAMFF